MSTRARPRRWPGKPLDLEVPLKPIGKGVYTVTWKTVSAVDGHLATGSYAFGVDVSPGSVHAPPPVAAAGPSVPAVVTRILLFTGLVATLGAVVLAMVAFGAPTVILRRTIAAGAVVSALGTVGVVAVQAIGVGSDAVDAVRVLDRAVAARERHPRRHPLGAVVRCSFADADHCW